MSVTVCVLSVSASSPVTPVSTATEHSQLSEKLLIMFSLISSNLAQNRAGEQHGDTGDSVDNHVDHGLL